MPANAPMKALITCGLQPNLSMAKVLKHSMYWFLAVHNNACTLQASPRSHEQRGKTTYAVKWKGYAEEPDEGGCGQWKKFVGRGQKHVVSSTKGDSRAT